MSFISTILHIIFRFLISPANLVIDYLSAHCYNPHFKCYGGSKIDFKAILFDLDGTLLDTLADIASAMNAVLARFGFPTHQLEPYKYFVGDGVENLVKRTLPKDRLDERTIAECFAAAKEEYHNHWNQTTKPYPGAVEMLSALDELDLKKVILSNKPDKFTKLTVTEFLGEFSFDIVRGVKDSVLPKPDPAAALQITKELNIPPSQFLYLGDTDTDMQTAVAAGMFGVGALWGFRTADELKQNGAKVLLQKPQDLLKLLET